MRNVMLATSAAVALALTAASPARADVIYNYAFSAGAGYSGNGDTASLSGTFSWDATTNTVVASDINLSGTDATGTDRGAVSCTNCTTSIYDTSGAQYFAINNGPQALYTVYANSLDLDAVDPLALSIPRGNGAEYQGGLPFTSVTGSANPVTSSAIPELSTWAMMLIGFASFGFGAFRVKRNRLDADFA